MAEWATQGRGGLVRAGSGRLTQAGGPAPVHYMVVCGPGHAGPCQHKHYRVGVYSQRAWVERKRRGMLGRVGVGLLEGGQQCADESYGSVFVEEDLHVQSQELVARNGYVITGKNEVVF